MKVWLTPRLTTDKLILPFTLFGSSHIKMSDEESDRMEQVGVLLAWPAWKSKVAGG